MYGGAREKTSTVDGGDFGSFSDDMLFQDDWKDAGDIFSYADLLVGNEWIDVALDGCNEMDHVQPAARKPAQISLPSSNAQSRKDLLPLGFLENITRSPGLVSSFDCGTEEQRSMALLTFRARFIPQPSPDDSLSMKSYEIVALVREVVSVKPRNSPVSLTWSSQLENMCIRFFSPQQIRLNLELYWAIWHPNVNFVHRPTFDPGTAKPVLIAAMCVLGARVSPENSHSESANVWRTCVEEIVFQDDDLCDDEKHSGHSPSLQRIQSLQAAFIVALFQNWDGDEATKRRIRRFRYSTMVAVSVFPRNRLLRLTDS